jgi:hypothetical protein
MWSFGEGGLLKARKSCTIGDDGEMKGWWKYVIKGKI